jgi:bla regulator protein blaR1
MPSALFTHLWQSTFFAGAAGLLTLALKRNRARTRYWVWFVGLVKFLAPFGLLVSLGGHFSLPRWTPKPPGERRTRDLVRDGREPARFDSRGGGSKDRARSFVDDSIRVWACGFVAIIFCWGRRWTRIYADVRRASGSPIDIGIPVMSSRVLREPGVPACKSPPSGCRGNGRGTFRARGWLPIRLY